MGPTRRKVPPEWRTTVHANVLYFLHRGFLVFEKKTEPSLLNNFTHMLDGGSLNNSTSSAPLMPMVLHPDEMRAQVDDVNVLVNDPTAPGEAYLDRCYRSRSVPVTRAFDTMSLTCCGGESCARVAGSSKLGSKPNGYDLLGASH
jgi:hypothetical protein